MNDSRQHTAEVAPSDRRRHASAAVESQDTLLEAARLLSATLDLGSALRETTGLFVPRFADYCLVYLTDPAGALHLEASLHVDPTKQPLLDALEALWQQDVMTPHSPAARALRPAAPVLRRETSPRDAELFTGQRALLRIFRELNPMSYMAVPLIARGKDIGTVMLVSSESGRPCGESDRTVVELLAARAALALESARHYAEAQASHANEVRASQLETQLAHAKLDALRAQLNPHFLFNTLNTIAMLVRRQAGEEALRGIVGLASLLRQVLDSRSHPEMALSDEFTLADRYLEIEQLRFRDRLHVQLSLEPDARDARVPTMILQPLVENAVRHGVARKSGPGTVMVMARRDEEIITIRVVDDGPGFDSGWDLAGAHGVGLANTRDRLRQMYGDAHRLTARNVPEGGAMVELQLPYRSATQLAPHAAGRAGREK